MTNEKRRRGFAAMSQEQRREIARKGGQAAQRKGTGHRFTSEEARDAGRKGGQAISQDRAHMARIGRGGGARSASVRREPGRPRPSGSDADPGIEVAGATAADEETRAPDPRAAHEEATSVPE